jgi:hypothetical protein
MMKKLLCIYLLSLVSIFFAHEVNADDPFNVRPWAVDSEDEHQKFQDNASQAEESDVGAENNLPE